MLKQKLHYIVLRDSDQKTIIFLKYENSAFSVNAFQL